MPHGYAKQTDQSDKIKYSKTHKNGARTEVDFEKVPNSGQWFGYVNDEGRTEELGRFPTKSEAKSAAKDWMRQNPKGIQDNSGVGGLFGVGNNDGLF